MNDWFSSSLGDGLTALPALDDIQKAFYPIFKAQQCPNDMAVFTRHESEGRLHCDVTVYFSPAAVGVAKIFQASPCIIPVAEGLSLLAGSEASWAVLFTDKA